MERLQNVEELNMSSGVVWVIVAIMLLTKSYSVTFIIDFQKYLRAALRISVNTGHANLKILRRYIIDAISEELILPERNPFSGIRLKTENSSRQFLREEMIIETFYYHPAGSEPRARATIKYFHLELLYLCCTCIKKRLVSI